MYEDLRSSTVFSPESMGELVNYKQKHPQALFWAGGTYLMAKEVNYPSKNPINIISLGKMDELKRITRNDTSVEFGSMASIQTVTAIARNFFSKDICNALNATSTQLIRRMATIGGALCTQKIKTSFTTIMMTLDANIECRIVGKKPLTKWIQLDNMFDKSGSLVLSPSTLITRLHINADKDSIFYFKETGSPMTQSDYSVVFAMRSRLLQNSITETRACFNFPSIGLHLSEAVQSSLTGVVLPMNPVRIIRLTEALVNEIRMEHPALRPIQVEQASRMFESYLYDLNAKVIARS
ncbi:MAG: FAD binding domain-containing protein [Sphaerochaetaceae bacterium]|jgi:CO/xanthine dehydrogenase FAD-binding subunit|nr:FAD binding domain-containing protein [Sphaerochaetaceae bacterium]NLY07222.1 hypothetical protein [Spirochaetales bacterium]